VPPEAAAVRPRGPLIALTAILVLGVLLRAWAVGAEYPASWNNWDTAAYLEAARNGLFDNFFRPAGYPLFLRVLHDVWPSVGFTVMLQHLLGLGTGVLVYLTGRRLGLSPWLALVPAAVIVLNGDQISLEHAMLSESIFTPMLVATVYALVRSLDSARPAAWLVVAGALAAGMVSVRAAALPLVGVVALAAALAPPLSRRGALRRAAIAGGTGVALVVVYASIAAATTGDFGISRGTGWAIYARTAPFADCRQFTPPEGTRPLCEGTAFATRPGPDFYLWADASPAWRAYGPPPNENSKVGAFGRTVILHQPLTYSRYVLSDMWRYVNAGSGHTGPSFGLGPDLLLIDRRAEEVEQFTEDQVADWYGPEPLRIRSSLATLADVQNVVRVHGSLVLLSVLLTLVALLLAPSRARWGAFLAGSMAIVVMLVPAATMVYHARYGVRRWGCSPSAQCWERRHSAIACRRCAAAVWKLGSPSSRSARLRPSALACRRGRRACARLPRS
jgi:hypothetical protein